MAGYVQRLGAEDLSAAQGTSHGYNQEQYDRRFSRDADRLFVSEEETLIKVMTVGQEGMVLFGGKLML